MTRQKEIRKTEYYQEQNLTTSLTTGPVQHAVSGRNTLRRCSQGILTISMSIKEEEAD